MQPVYTWDGIHKDSVAWDALASRLSHSPCQPHIGCRCCASDLTAQACSYCASHPFSLTHRLFLEEKILKFIFLESQEDGCSHWPTPRCYMAPVPWNLQANVTLSSLAKLAVHAVFIVPDYNAEKLGPPPATSDFLYSPSLSVLSSSERIRAWPTAPHLQPKEQHFWLLRAPLEVLWESVRVWWKHLKCCLSRLA